jgi:hypothetical protein
MKTCYRCGIAWRGYRNQPRSREVCEGCGAYLHSCVNCFCFDPLITVSCKLRHTAFVGPRDQANYCEEFRMNDTVLRANEDRLASVKLRWEQLFKS